MKDSLGISRDEEEVEIDLSEFEDLGEEDEAIQALENENPDLADMMQNMKNQIGEGEAEEKAKEEAGKEEEEDVGKEEEEEAGKEEEEDEQFSEIPVEENKEEFKTEDL